MEHYLSLGKCIQQQQQPNWSELPSCLLSEIMDRLNIIDDYVRFSAVCVSWRTVFIQESLSNKKKHCAFLPFLLIPPRPEQDDEEENNNYNYYKNNKNIKIIRWNRKPEPLCLLRGLYSVAREKVYNFQVQLPNNKYCRGSSFGWLLTIQNISEYDSKDYRYIVQLQNPFNNNIIDLPSIDNIIDNDGDDTPPKLFLYIHKAVLSSDPLLTPNNYMVMAIMSCFSKLAFFKHGTKAWVPIQWEDEEWSYFDDLIYFNKTQQFYAVINNTGAVVAIDFNTGGIGGQSDISTPKLTQIAPPTEKYGFSRKRYIVETSSGDLLQVIKETEYNESRLATTYQFEVFKLDPVGVKWIQIHDIGDTSLFLGDNSSISRCVSGFPGCKPNSIYYINDSNINHQTGWRYGCEETGIYNLNDVTVQQHYPTAYRKIFPAPIWLEPTLQR
ncbi:hypothetical protein AQUCO_02000356v1 [Aquilegia coerulea]|uniref:F-box domain-containing protein n=1 Tax=Aquilegia coerulea TaxID=218851 RepID=A0A2G5DH63_AQUCA|nr:hypothetical protein AQUCO_02000356v1 [Aquilegia coerulea]